MKNKFIASSVLAASVACSVGRDGVFAESRWLRTIKGFVGNHKAKIVSALVAFSAVLFRRNVTNVREIGDSRDIGDISRNVSHMFNSMSVEDFKDAMGCAHFYQLYLTYKFGYNGLVPISGEKEALFKKILYDAMMTQLNNGTAQLWFMEKLRGVNVLDAISKAIDFIKDLVDFKGKGNVPIFVAAGAPGSGKSYLFDLICEFLSGRQDNFDSLSLVGLDERATNAKIFGSPPSYQNSGVKPKETIGKIADPNRKFLPLRIDEIDKVQSVGLNAILEWLNDGRLSWNYNGLAYDTTFGIYTTANFQDHYILESCEETGKRFGIKYFDGALDRAILRDAANFFGGPFMSRIKYMAFFKPPTVKEAKGEIKKRINDTHGSKTLANFFIDPGSESKVLDVLYKELLSQGDDPKLPHRNVKNKLYSILGTVARRQNSGALLEGRRVNLRVDEQNHLRADLEWRDYF